VKVLDVNSGAITTIIQAIAGSPAGVTIDQSGNLYSGNGFGFDPSATGIIKAFPLCVDGTTIRRQCHKL